MLQLAAAKDVNPDDAGSPKPLRVRVLQLISTTALAQADFFALDADLAKALGTELLASDELILTPGQTISVSPEARPGIKFVGVVGAYHAIDRARWRVWAPVKPNASNSYTAQCNAAEIALKERGA
jgi:type VI secretion system protein VasD